MIRENLIKVKDHPNLFRDPKSKAIIVLDEKARSNYSNQKRLAEKVVSDTSTLNNKVEKLENDISQIKEMLSNLINNNK